MSLPLLILEQYQISPQTGFLPSKDPLKTLGTYFRPWEDVAQSLPEILKNGKTRKVLANLPLLSTASLQSNAEMERAMILLGFMGHAFVGADDSPSNFIPACISIPWVAIAQKLGRRPILSHASLVLNNWRKLDAKAPFIAENLKALVQLTEYPDESWFYMATVEVEASGATVPTLLMSLQEHMRTNHDDMVASDLVDLKQLIFHMKYSLSRMRKGCKPDIFYHKIRPYLSSFHNIKYEGVPDPLRNYHGGSAAQSSLLQSIDIALGITHAEDRSNTYLKEMLHYMPKPHAHFLHYLSTQPPVKTYCNRDSELEKRYNDCVEAMMQLRNEHLKIVANYIIAQAEGPAIGTGGTSPMEFLKQVRNDTGHSRFRPSN